MRRSQKKVLRWRGARFCLRVLMENKRSIKRNALKLLAVPGMKTVVKDDYWARGFVEMLRRKAGIEGV